MPKGSLHTKKRRQDELLSCLRSRSYWTTATLCEQLSTSYRTLMRDLAELKESGIPIESERGRGGGIRLNGRWGIGRLQLSNTEVISLLLALVIAEAINSPILQHNLRSIRHRISSAFPFEQRQKVEQLRARIMIGEKASDEMMSSYQAPTNDFMPLLSQCFIDMKMLNIDYLSGKKEITTRTVEPQMLLLNWPIWYLLCWDELRNDIRVFRIDRIQSAAKLNQSFKLRRNPELLRDLSAYFKIL